MISTLIKLSEKKLIPDSAIRFGIRTLLRKRIGSLVSINPEINIQNKIDFIHIHDYTTSKKKATYISALC